MDSDAVTAIVIIGLPTIIWGGYAYFRAWIKHEERKLEIMGYVPNAQSSVRATAELEERIQQVQQMSNDYDLSIQHTLDNIQRRLEFIESQSQNQQYRAGAATTTEEPQIQRTGYNPSQS